MRDESILVNKIIFKIANDYEKQFFTIISTKKSFARDLSFVTSENQSRGSAVVKNLIHFLRFCPMFPGEVERVIRCPFIVSLLRMLAARARQDDFFRRRCEEREERSLLPPSQKWLLSARSTWLIAGVILARLTFGIKWQLRSPPGAAARSERALRESLGRKFRSLSPESINLDYKLRPLRTARRARKQAGEFFSLGPRDFFSYVPTTSRDHASFVRSLASATNASKNGNNQDIYYNDV